MKNKHILRLSFLLLFASTISFAQTTTAAQALAQNGLTKAISQDREGAIIDYTKSLALEKNPDTYYKRGVAYFLTKQYTKAIEDFNNAEVGKKDDADLFSLRAKCKAELKDNENAIIDFNKAIELRPSSGEFYFFRALSKISLKDKDGACKDLRKAIDLNYGKALSTLQTNCN